MAEKDKYGRSTKFYESSGKENLKTYLDSKGIPTIGVGHKITPAEAKSKIFAKGISPQMEYEIFNDDVTQTSNKFYDRNPKYITYPKTVRNGLEDLAFNQGPNFLNKFPNMKKALDKEDFVTAATELLSGSKRGTDSKYVKDVGPNRSNANAMRIADGYNTQFALNNPLPNTPQLSPTSYIVENQGGLGGNRISEFADNKTLGTKSVARAKPLAANEFNGSFSFGKI